MVFQGFFKGYFKGSSRGCLRGGAWKGTRKGTSEGLQTGLGRGLAVVSSSGHLRSRAGLVQVWISLELKFHSLELISEVGRLVFKH